MGFFVAIVIIIGIVIFVFKITNSRSDYTPSSLKIKNTPVDLSFQQSETKIGHYLIFDIETTGLPKYKNGTPDGSDNWPYVVQIAWLLFDKEGYLIESNTHILKQQKPIPIEAIRIHRISNSKTEALGKEPKEVYFEFENAIKMSKYMVAHNVDFDWRITESDMIRNGFERIIVNKRKICTMLYGTNFCKITGYSGRDYKWPSLEELYFIVFM